MKYEIDRQIIIFQSVMSFVMASDAEKLIKKKVIDMPKMKQSTPSVASTNRYLRPFICSNSPHIKNRKKSGFSLIELVVTLSVVSILIVFAIPSFREFVLNMRLRAQTNSLITDISTARNTATTTPARVIICTSSNGLTCDGSGWSSGRLIYWEKTQTPFGAGPAADGSRTIRYTEALPTSIQSYAPTSYPDPLIFDTFGRPIDTFGAPLSATVAMPLIFTFCDVEKKVTGRQVTINAAGSPSTVPYVCP